MLRKIISVAVLILLLTSTPLSVFSLFIPLLKAVWVWESPIPYVASASEISIDGEIIEEPWYCAKHFHNFSTHKKTIEFEAYLMHDGASIYIGVVIHDNDFWSTYSVLGDAFKIEINDRNDGRYGGESGNDLKVIIVTAFDSGMYYDAYIPADVKLDTVVDGEGAFIFYGLRENGEVGDYNFELKIPITGSHPEDASLHVETPFGMMVSFVDYDPDENVGYGYWILQGSFVLEYGESGVWVGGPVYIRADGSIDPPDAPIVTVDKVTYTLTGNITSSGDGIIVERDNVVIDGAGYTVQGLGAGNGIDLSGRFNVTIKNTNIKDFNTGVKLFYYSENNVISGNNITNNANGIYMDYSSNNNTVSGNTIANNVIFSIYMWHSSGNTVSGNNITNSFLGIYMLDSSGNTFFGNLFVNCGLLVFRSYGNVVVDNTVNGRPLIYLEGASDVAVKDAGQVILVNCNNITVQNLNLSNTTAGIELYNTHNSTINGNNITNNTVGIHLRDSSNNVISGNNITNNNYYGIEMGYSSNNVISGNNIANNWIGIYMGYSSNTVSGNNIANNNYGIYLAGFSGNVISGNNITNNTYGVLLGFSSGNRFYHNNGGLI